MDLPKNFKAAEAEARWQAFWNESQTYAWDSTRPREEAFVVDTPPPTVSGSLHVGHMFSYSHQDFIVRYQRMRGKNVFFPIGWDDNGLPTERRVQNLYNVKCDPTVHFDPNLKPERGRKGDPLPISRTNFINLCQEVTREDEEAFKHLWSRLGLSYDWAQEYATIDERCRKISQRSFLELLQKDEIYQAERPVMWDVDFQTAIAQAEVEDRERPSAYHYLRFGVSGGEDHLVVATTRPELLAACVAVLVHPDDERYSQYVGQHAVTPLFKVPVPIMADPKADPAKGTGVVMVCTFGDQTDVEWWRQYSLPLRTILGKNGHLLPVRFVGPKDTIDGSVPLERHIPSDDPAAANAVYEQLSGKYAKAAQKIIVELAEQDGTVLDRPRNEISHAVKFFEKGDRPLELIPTRQWYTKIMDKKEPLVAQGKKIAWHPEFMGKRYEHWVEGLNQDWCVSRQRYFGVPIPVWYKIDETGEVRYDQRVLPDPSTLPIDPLDAAPPGYSNDQRDQPNGFTGDPDVLDTWATSSLTPQIAAQWSIDDDRFQKLFPMDIRPQSHEIIRTWAFYTIVKAYLHENEIPWRNVVISGWILDPDRKKMSKSQGNVVTPEPLIDQYGADSVRYWAARARLGVDTAYDELVFKVGNKLVTKLFNASKFTLQRIDGIDPALLTVDKVTEETDRAVVAELRPLIERATQAFDQFDYAQALQITEDFFYRTFCDNYLELAKPRTYDEALTPGRLSAATTLRLVHRTLLRLLAPFIPYITEEVWSWTYSTSVIPAPPSVIPAQAGTQHPPCSSLTPPRTSVIPAQAGTQQVAGAQGPSATSIHRTPWPSLAEFAAIPAPQHPLTWEATLAVLEGVRKFKADQNASMAAPLAIVEVLASAEALPALQCAQDDIQRMLRIETLNLQSGAPAATAEVTACILAPPEK